jgi:hypothetical protein
MVNTREGRKGRNDIEGRKERGREGRKEDY